MKRKGNEPKKSKNQKVFNVAGTNKICVVNFTDHLFLCWIRLISLWWSFLFAAQGIWFRISFSDPEIQSFHLNPWKMKKWRINHSIHWLKKMHHYYYYHCLLIISAVAIGPEAMLISTTKTVNILQQNN